MQESLKGLTGWEYVIASSILTIVGIGGVWIRKWLETRKMNAPQDTISRMVKIYDCLNEVSSRVQNDRSLIMYTSNGGGIPSTKTPVYATVLYELVHGQDLSPIRKDFQQIPIDAGHAKVLNEVIGKGLQILEVKTLGSGFLKDFYLADGSTHIAVCELTHTKDKYFYLCLVWKTNKLDKLKTSVTCGTFGAKLKSLLDG